MGVCRLCKYHTTPKQLKTYNEWLSDLIKKKIEQDKKKLEEESKAEEEKSDEDTEDSTDGETSENESSNENEEPEGSSNENDDENISTHDLDDEGNEPPDDNEGSGNEPSEDNEEPENPDEDDSEEEDKIEDAEKEEEIEIPEDACFKFILPLPRPIPFTPLRLRREKFLPPPITRFDMMHLCSHPDHVRKDHIKGDEWLACCAIFNRFEECLLFEEAEPKDIEDSEDDPETPDGENTDSSFDSDIVVPDDSELDDEVVP